MDGEMNKGNSLLPNGAPAGSSAGESDSNQLLNNAIQTQNQSLLTAPTATAPAPSADLDSLMSSVLLQNITQLQQQLQQQPSMGTDLQQSITQLQQQPNSSTDLLQRIAQFQQNTPSANNALLQNITQLQEQQKQQQQRQQLQDQLQQGNQVQQQQQQQQAAQARLVHTMESPLVLQNMIFPTTSNQTSQQIQMPSVNTNTNVITPPELDNTAKLVMHMQLLSNPVAAQLLEAGIDATTVYHLMGHTASQQPQPNNANHPLVTNLINSITQQSQQDQAAQQAQAQQVQAAQQAQAQQFAQQVQAQQFAQAQAQQIQALQAQQQAQAAQQYITAMHQGGLVNPTGAFAAFQNLLPTLHGVVQPASGTTGGATQDGMAGPPMLDMTTGKGAKKGKKQKIKGKPKRPLSAYNFFFREEKDRMYKEMDEKEKVKKKEEVEEEKKVEDGDTKKEEDASDKDGGGGVEEEEKKVEEGDIKKEEDASDKDGGGEEEEEEKKVENGDTKKEEDASDKDGGNGKVKVEHLTGKKRKATGKIGFEDLARMIGKKWKEDVEPESMERYKKLAAEDMERYKKEMLAFDAKQSGNFKYDTAGDNNDQEEV